MPIVIHGHSASAVTAELFGDLGKNGSKEGAAAKIEAPS
jgi:hypothetical protein